MRRVAMLLSLVFAAQAAIATKYVYSGAPVTDGKQIEFSFTTDATSGFFTDLTSFDGTEQFFASGVQYGTGTFTPGGFGGTIGVNSANVSFSAMEYISYTPITGGPPYRGKGPGFLFSGTAAAVPEPASWALMLGGFGLIGAGLRRRAPTVRFA